MFSTSQEKGLLIYVSDVAFFLFPVGFFIISIPLRLRPATGGPFLFHTSPTKGNGPTNIGPSCCSSYWLGCYHQYHSQIFPRRRRRRRRPRPRYLPPRYLRPASAGVTVAPVIAVARVVTPRVVPIVVPTALMHQNTAIATAATVWANSFPGDKRRFIIPLLSHFKRLHAKP